MKKKTHRRNTLNIHFRAFLQREFEHFFYFNNVRTLNTMSNTKREIKLKFSKNWNVWLSIVRAKINEYLIWKLINSSKKTKSINKLEFIKFDLNTQLNDNFNEKLVKYKITFSKYKKKLQNWKKQTNFMTKIINHIYDITSTTNLNFIQNIEIHSWNVLRTLKTRLIFFDSIKSLKLKQQYDRMIKNFFNRQNIDVWLNDYLKMFTFVKQTKIVEIIDNKRVYKNFLHSIEKIAFIFVEIYEFQLKKIIDHETKFLLFIEIFRHHMRMKKTRKKKSTTFNSTFIVNENKKNDHSHLHEFSFRNKQQKQLLCLCEKKHSYENCYYLNEKIRFAKWKLKSKIVIKINEILKNLKKKRSVETSIKRKNKKRQKKRKKNENKKKRKKKSK